MNLPKKMNDNVSKNTQLNKKQDSKSNLHGEDFWKDCEEHVGIHHRSSSQEIQKNFQTPAFTTKKDLHENSDSSNDFFADSKNKKIKDEYATFEVNEAIEKEIKPISKNSAREEKFQQLLKRFDFTDEMVKPTKKLTGIEDEVKKGIDRFNILYEKGKIKNEMKKTLQEKNNEIKVKEEMSQCTFRPKINDNKRIQNILLQNRNKEDTASLYTRNEKWNKKKADKITKDKKLIMKKNDDFTFKPITNKPNMEVIFKENKNINYDSTSRHFCERLENARKEEESKKKRVYRDLSKILGKKWSKNNPRSASCENYGLIYQPDACSNSMIQIKNYKRNLHEELHSFNIYNDNE